MRTMIWIASSLLFLLNSCGDSSVSNEPVTSKKIETVEVEQKQTDKVSPRYKNGINDQNKGDKTGNVRLHGSISAKSGSYMYLFQTEARTKTLIDSTEIQGGVYNFKKVEVSRGFYELQLNGAAKNACTIIINPDEVNIQIDFKSSRLNGARTPVNSNENKAWFAYQSKENKNNNEIKNLRKGMKDTPYRKRIALQIKDKDLELIEKQIDIILTHVEKNKWLLNPD